jgi:hypothetical protein
MPKFDHITVKLTGRDGNAFTVMGIVTNAMKQADVDQADIDEYFKRATSGDYDNLLRVTQETVNVT